MDFLPRLGISLVCALLGIALMYWSTSFSAFNGVLGILEDFLPQGLRTGLRRVVNTLFGLLLIGIGLVIFLLAGGQSTNKSQTSTAIDKASVASPATNSSTTGTSGPDAPVAPTSTTDNGEKPASSN